jgi:hypothetical protein
MNSRTFARGRDWKLLTPAFKPNFIIKTAQLREGFYQFRNFF